MKRFRRGLALKAHSLLYHSTLGSRVVKKKRRDLLRNVIQPQAPRPQTPNPWRAHRRGLDGTPAGYHQHPAPYTLLPTPYTLHPTPYTLHPTPYTPCTLHPNTRGAQWQRTFYMVPLCYFLTHLRGLDGIPALYHEALVGACHVPSSPLMYRQALSRTCWGGGAQERA